VPRCQYVHVGTGNYHEGTARLYEDLGLLSADPELAAPAAAVFNELTAGIPAPTLCCLRAGVPGLSPTIRVYSTLGRFLEHSRIYRFENGGAPEFFIGSADWMTRNLSRRMETVAPVCDPAIKAELEDILATSEEDNYSASDMQPDGEYIRRRPAAGEARRGAQP
jgi:polyphosphate kinase